MFWNTVELNFETDVILTSESCSLSELLDASDVLEKTKEQNPQLINFLLKREILTELIQVITAPHSIESFNRDQYKQAYVATEIFNCLQPSLLHEHLLGYDDRPNQPLLESLINFFPTEGSVNSLSASLVCRCLAHLTGSLGQEMINFFKQHSFLHRIIGHFDTSAVCDFVLRILNFDCESAQPALAWFFDEGAVFKLANYLTGQFSEDYQDMAAHFLDSLYVNMRNHLQNVYHNDQDLNDAKRFMPAHSLSPSEDSKSQECAERERVLCNSIQEVLSQIESIDMIELLLDSLFSRDEEDQFVPVYAAKILLSVINKRKIESSFPIGAGGINDICELLYASHSEDSSSEPKEDPQTIHVRGSCEKVFSLIMPKLPRMHDALLSRPKQINGAFGRNRVALCQFLMALISCDCPREIEMRRLREKAAQKCASKRDLSPDTGSLLGPLDQQSPVLFQQSVISDEAKLALIQGLIESKIFTAVMELFYEYPHNWFLHETMKRLIDAVLVFAGYEYITKMDNDSLVEIPEKQPTCENKENHPPAQCKKPEMVHQLLISTGLIQWTMKYSPHVTADVSWTEPSSRKPGFFGHLLQITKELSAFENEILRANPGSNPFADYLNESEREHWRALVVDQVRQLDEVVNSVWDVESMDDEFSALGNPMAFFADKDAAALHIFSHKFAVNNFTKLDKSDGGDTEECNPLSFSSFSLPDPTETEQKSSFGRFHSISELGMKEEMANNLSDCSEHGSTSDSDLEHVNSDEESDVAPRVIRQRQQPSKLSQVDPESSSTISEESIESNYSRESSPDYELIDDNARMAYHEKMAEVKVDNSEQTQKPTETSQKDQDSQQTSNSSGSTLIQENSADKRERDPDVI